MIGYLFVKIEPITNIFTALKVHIFFAGFSHLNSKHKLYTFLTKKQKNGKIMRKVSVP